MRLGEVIDRQSGLVTRRQATGAGLTLGALNHKLTSGRWQAVFPGIYATFSGDLTGYQRMIAAQLYGGPASLLGGQTAAALHGLRQLPRNRSVHLLLPHRVHRSSHAFVRVRRTWSVPAPVFLDDLRTVTVGRAVVDACRAMTRLDAVRALVAESVQRRLTTVAVLSAELAAGGSAGSALTRLVLAEVAVGTESVAEIGAQALLARSGLPPAEWNRDLFTPDGDWLARPDAWWRDSGVVLEVDSQEWHLLPESWKATMRRHARMTSYGLLVVHEPPSRLMRERAAVVALLRRTIDAGSRRPTPAVTDVAPPGWRRGV